MSQLTTEELRTAYEQAAAEEIRLEKIMIAAEIAAADNVWEHVKAFHDAESEYQASWHTTTEAYTRWASHARWDKGMAA